MLRSTVHLLQAHFRSLEASIPSPSGAWRRWGPAWRRCSLLVLGFLLELVRSLFVLFTDLVELLHVLKEVWAPLQGDEKLGLLAVTSLAVSPVA